MGLFGLACARQLSLQRVVAIKMILAGAHAGPDELRRFRGEAESAARLQHPHIVQIHEIGEHDGLPYFVLEFVDGPSLAQHLRGNPVAADHAAELVETVARAMHYAHRREVIHRDLKPGNILLQRTSDAPPPTDLSPENSDSAIRISGYVPKITDFGLAKRLDDVTERTHSGDVMGTPSYMAPEQAEGRGAEIGIATDVYALGAVLYELMTGRPPFKGATAFETVRHVATQEPVAPRRLRPRLPRDLDTICLKCLDKVPKRRYPSAEALADDLRRFLGREPILARRASKLERAFKWSRRHPHVATLSALLLLVAIAGFVGVMLLWLQARTNQRQAQEQLVSALVVNGTHLMDEGDLLAALPPLVQALAHDNDEERQMVHRLRIGTIGELAAKLTFSRVHGGPVHSVHFTNNGRHLITAGDDGMAVRWDIQTAKELVRFRGHTAEIRDCILSPDGRRLITVATRGESARLWDTNTGNTLRALGISESAGPVFSADGRHLIFFGIDELTHLVDSETGEEQATINHAESAKPSGYSRDGRHAVAIENNVLRVTNLHSGELLESCAIPETPLPDGASPRMPPSGVIFSDDGATVALIVDHSTVFVWNWKLRNSKPLLKAHGAISEICFSPDASQVCGIVDDNCVSLWSLAPDGSVGRVFPHPARVRSTAFSADGKRLLTTCDDRRVRILDVRTGVPVFAPLRHSDGVLSAKFDESAESVATVGADHAVRVWKLPRIHTLRHEGEIEFAAFSADGKRVIASGSGMVRLWNFPTGAAEHLSIPDKTVARAALGSRGHVGLACGDGSVSLRHEGRSLEVASSIPYVALYWIEFSGNGDRFLASGDRGVTVWATDSRAEIATFPTDGAVAQAVFSPDGRRVAGLCSNGTVKLWDTETRTESASLFHPPRFQCSCISFSPDGSRLAAAGSRGMVLVWDANTGAKIQELQGHNRDVDTVTFSPDGRRLLSAGSDGTARVWDSRTGDWIHLLNHAARVKHAVFSFDGWLIATASEDSTCRIWDASSGQPISPPLRHESAVHHVAFNPSGTHFMSAGADGTARIRSLVRDDRPLDVLRREATLQAGYRLDAKSRPHYLRASELDWTTSP